MQTITVAPPKRSWFSLLSWAILLAVLVVSWKGAEMAPLTLIQDSGNMATFAADFFPPDFSQWQDYLGEMAVTLQIAVWGTALAVVLSIPFGLMCADNLVPWWIYQPMRRLMDACRAINEMVFAMLFVVAVGLGPFAGVMALFDSKGGATVGWTHYLAFDLFTGLWIARDADAKGFGRLVQLPILFATLMVGPVGLLLWLILRERRARAAAGR